MPLPRLALISFALCLLGGLAGLAASFTPPLPPLPWLLGSLAACATLTIGFPPARSPHRL